MIVAEVCWPCVVGLHDECLAVELVESDDIEGNWVRCCCFNRRDEDAEAFVRGVGRPLSEPSDITDIVSTGRKRAAMMYPIYEGMVCEWAGLRYAGGGVEPIIGCDGNTLSTGKGPDKGDRHHGPDKNVINNSPDNVHRICSRCHNRYHAQNNKYYPGDRPPTDQPWLPEAPEGMTVRKHDSETLATDEEIEENEAYWSGRKIKVDIED